MNENNTVIEINGISKKFNDFQAVTNLNIEITKGEVLGFLGPNGAGKTTTMKMLANLIEPTEGEIWIKDNGDMKKLSRSTKDSLLNNIGFLIENPTFYDNVTPRLILTYFAKLKGYERKKIKNRVEEVVSLIGMSEWIDKKISTFSKGMRQKIGIISTIVHDPAIIILDEPYTGLDPKARKEIRQFILKLKEQGKTIFLSSHLLYEVSEVADRVGIIFEGKLIAIDTLANLEAQVKRSVIKFDVLNLNKSDIETLVHQMKDLIRSITGLNNKGNWLSYNLDSKTFELRFDGQEENQFKILEKLMESGIKVIDYSVPKAGLLEDLYLNLMSKHENGSNTVYNEKNQNYELQNNELVQEI